MSDFVFRNVAATLVEDGAVRRLGEIVQSHFPDVKTALVVTDESLVKLGLVIPALDSLKECGITPVVFDAVEPDPSEVVVLSATVKAREVSADVIIGFGGGSSMDVAKLVAVLAGGEQKLADIYGLDQVRSRDVPLIQVPTTAGTGSEVTPISIVTRPDESKMGVVDRHLLADMAVLDATLTLGLPSHITAATGIDAMVHAIEAYTSAIKKNPVSDALAVGALKLLGGSIIKACKDGSDLDSRRNMLVGAMMAGCAFTNAPVAAVHALAYPLGGRFHIPHGLSNSLVLPHVLRFNASVAAPQYAELADVMGLGGDTDVSKTEAFIDWLENIADTVGIERRLRQLNIGEQHIQMLAEDAMQQTRLLVNNPRPLAYDDAVKIYEAAL